MTIRSPTGDADAGVRAYGAGCSTPRRSFSTSATHSDGNTDVTAMALSATSASTTAGIAHQRWCREPVDKPRRSAASAAVSGRDIAGPDEASGGGSVDVRVSVTLALSVEGLTIRAALILGLAIAALLLTGWRKPARAEARSPRGVVGTAGSRPTVGVTVDHTDAPRYRRPGVIRRVFALAASSGIGVLTGIVTAIVFSFAIAIAVIWMTNLLER